MAVDLYVPITIPAPDDGGMTPARLLLDIWLVLVVLSAAGIAGISISWMLISIATVAAAARRDRRKPARLGSLRGRLGESDLADIDEALERILAAEHGALPRARGHVRSSFRP
jgi:hypothetical protein